MSEYVAKYSFPNRPPITDERNAISLPYVKHWIEKIPHDVPALVIPESGSFRRHILGVKCLINDKESLTF